MPNLFFISDTHFGHANILNFARNDTGQKVRPGFADVSDMDETIIRNWNRVVRPQDHVYHLGDVAMKKQLLPIVKRLNGHKRLVFGNHDIFEYKEYAKVGFEKMMGMRVMDGIIFTHVPVHPSSLGRFKINVHGHLHNNPVRTEDGLEDRRYRSVCVEMVNYTPVSLDEIRLSIT